MARLLQVPPFPGARAAALETPSPDRRALSESEAGHCIEQLRRLRVGGTYWAAQPELPASPYTLIRIAEPGRRAQAAASAEGTALVWADDGDITGDCDPWHLLGGAKRAIVDSDDQLALIAAIAGVKLQCVGDGPFSSLERGGPAELANCFRSAVEGAAFADPFTGKAMSLSEAIELCGFWRRLIDSNRDIGSAVGFGSWKQETVAPLLWDGSSKVPFDSGQPALAAGETVAVWKARTPAKIIERLESSGANLVEVEDGFIRSVGLGADCVPPLSIVVDRSGIYFDPGQPSDLETLLQSGDYGEPLLGRARALRELIVEAGVSKYAVGKAPLERRVIGKRHLLVPGQVEDDRSVMCGGGEVKSNLELLRRVRACAPDAFISFKPHPDVEAGHRAGALADSVALEFADEIVRDQPITALMDIVDEVHVNTSLAGFEALLRSRAVTTHGVPFYAGWGLTTDLGAVPARRSATRSLDELVAAALLLYPRYVDPVTGLPCPAEILLKRLREGTTGKGAGTLVRLRRLEGKLKRAASMLRIWR